MLRTNNRQLFNPDISFVHDSSLINDGGDARIDFVFWRARPVGFGKSDRGQFEATRPCISCGGAMMVGSDIFQPLKGFDPLFGPEEIDFSLSLQKAGYKAMYIPKAVGYHQVSHTYGDGYSEDYARHKSRHWLTFMRRHASLQEKIAFYLFGAPSLIIQVVLREILRGNWRAIRGLAQGLLSNKSTETTPKGSQHG